jgi:hypothetical protein
MIRNVVTPKKPEPTPKIPILMATAKGGANYKVDVTLAVKLFGDEVPKAEGRDMRAVVDTGAAPVIVRLGALPERVDIFPLTEVPLLIDAQRKAISLLGVVKFCVNLGDREYDTLALVAEDLSVDLI